MAAGDVGNNIALKLGGTAVSSLVSVDWRDEGNRVDVTSTADTHRTFENGVRLIEFSCEAIGTQEVEVGDTGTLNFRLPGSGTGGATADVISTAICVAEDIRFPLDSPVTTTLTFVPKKQ